MNSKTSFLTPVLAAALAFTLFACEQQGPAEKAGENIDEAVDNVGDAAEDAAEAVGDKVEEAGDAVKDATSN